MNFKKQPGSCIFPEEPALLLLLGAADWAKQTAHLAQQGDSISYQ